MVIWDKVMDQVKSVEDKKIEGIWSALWDKVFKNGSSNIRGRQPLKHFKGYGLLKQTIIPSNFLKAVFHIFYLVHS